MEIIERKSESIESQLSTDELNILIKVIDKIFYSLSESDIKVRIGMCKKELVVLLSSLAKHKNNDKPATNIKFMLNDILMLNNALNEVFNGINIIDFESEIGVSREKYKVFFQSIRDLIDSDEKTSHLNQNIDTYKTYADKSKNNLISKEKIYLNTENYQVCFYLRRLDNSESRVGIVLVFKLNCNINGFTIKTTAQSINCADLREMIKYIEKHIYSLERQPSNDLSTFLNCQKSFQIQALSVNLASGEKESFPLRFMINVGSQDNERSNNTYVGAEALVSLKNIQFFISSLKTALNKLCLQ
jgi:hypothetical protein